MTTRIGALGRNYCNKCHRPWLSVDARAPRTHASDTDPPILKLTLVETCLETPNGLLQPHSQIRLKVGRLRLVARAAFISRLNGWAGQLTAVMKNSTASSYEAEMGSQGGGRTPQQPASSSSGSAANSQQQLLPPRVKMRIAIRGPLLVLPSPRMQRAAVLIRVGDFRLRGDVSLLEDSFPYVHHIRADLRMMQILVAPPQLNFDKRGQLIVSRLLTEDWQLVRNARPHWLLSQLGLTLIADTTEVTPDETNDESERAAGRMHVNFGNPLPTIESIRSLPEG